MSHRLFLMVVLGLSALSAYAQPEGWTDDYDAALKRAAAEHKTVLVDFTGSDWCGWCKKLDAEVFSTPDFKAYAEKSLVLVYIDFPRSSKPRDPAQNQGLAEKFAVQGYPTILLLDGAGSEIGRTGYRAGGPAGYIQHLDRFAKLTALKAGLDDKLKAAATDEAKREVYLELVRAATALDAVGYVAEHVAAADPKNENGMQTALATLQASDKLAKSKDADASLAILAAHETKFPESIVSGDLAQKFHLKRGECYGALAQRNQQQPEVMKQHLEQLFGAYKLAYKAAPTNEFGPKIKKWLEAKGQKVE